ncbi:MAG: radical SAM protein [Cyanobacteria bacterium P01_F01_bin.150]
MSLAASKGGIYKGDTDLEGDQISIVRYWQAVGKKLLSGAELYQKLLPEAQPIQLEVGIGNECGMNCEHCYLAYPPGELHTSSVSIENLNATVAEMVRTLHTRMVCVADRDALTPGRSMPFFRHLASLREEFPDLKFGGVTNGLLMPVFVEDLAQLPLDYLDISIEGLREEHDNIRGKGHFDRAIKNLKLAQKHKVADRIMVAHTLTRYNDDSLLYLIHELITKEGVDWFDIGPFMAVAPKMLSHQLRETDLAEFLESLATSLHPLEVDRPINILIELCAYCASFLPALVDKGWLIPEIIKQDRYGHLYQIIPVNSSINLILRPELISEYWRHTLRISFDGYVIGGCEPLTNKNYQKLSVGNIKNGDIKSIYKGSLEINSPFHSSMLSIDRTSCRTKSCFQYCLGGDSLLSKSIYDDYNKKDPNCIWDEYSSKSPNKSIDFYPLSESLSSI